MADQYVFELKFTGKGDGLDGSEQYVIIDGSSMADFARLKEDLSMCTSEPFAIQYIDDEEDIISIDTEDEFKEFAKLAKQRSSRGMMLKIILNSAIPSIHGQALPHADGGASALFTDGPTQPSSHSGMDALRAKLKSELKKEILSELKDEIISTSRTSSITVTDPSKMETFYKKVVSSKEPVYEEDSDGNLVVSFNPEKKKGKLLLRKSFEKKEKSSETKIDQRLEKLELKRKRLMEKYHKCPVIPKHGSDDKPPLPTILSAIATKGSLELNKKIPIGNRFVHVWTILNDGTVPLTNAELRHTWSTPGLEPEELVLKVQPLIPGEEGTITVKFKAPKNLVSFFTFWHFYISGNDQQFGHYVYLRGSTKMPKSLSTSSADKVPENVKKAKLAPKTVTFSEGAVVIPSNITEKEDKILNKESNEMSVDQMPRCTVRVERLASSVIAAEMAKEAANAKTRRAGAAVIENPNVQPVDIMMSVTQAVDGLNLLDNCSNTHANLETNETDCGFVNVNIVPHSDREPRQMDQKEENIGNVEVQENQASQSNETVGDAAVEKDRTKNVPLAEPLFPKLSNDYPMTPFLLATAPRFYPPGLPPPYLTMVPPPNPSSQSIMFPPPPPPPLLNMTVPKMNPPVNYPQFPTYPPLIPPSVTTMPAQSTFATQPQITPQMTRNPMAPSQLPFAFTPMHFCGNSPHVPPTTTTTHGEYWIPMTTNSTVSSSAPTVGTTDSSVRTEIITERPHQSFPPSFAPAEATNSAEGHQAQTQPDLDGQSKMAGSNGSNIQILPQALVDGAINVATSAYSTAWSALNNLRPKEGPSEFDPVFENNMLKLVEMGFNNLERNSRLLKRFNNDIGQVIAVICSTGGQHNLDID